MVRGVLEDILPTSLLHDLSPKHDGNIIGHIFGNTQIVSNKKVS
jgi:hypothetical protein